MIDTKPKELPQININIKIEENKSKHNSITSSKKFVDLKPDPKFIEKREDTEQSERGIRFRKAPRPTTAKGFEPQKKSSMPPI